MTLTVNGKSDDPTCGNLDYTMDVEVFSVHGLSGYLLKDSSMILSKTLCSRLPYPTINISTASLCPGEYTWRARERISNGAVAAWMAGDTFTIAGNQQFAVEITASDTVLCGPQTVTLNADAIGACGNVSFLWQALNIIGPSITIVPQATQTFSVIANDPITGATASKSITIVVDSSVIPGVATSLPAPQGLCTGDSVVLELTGSAGDIQWQWKSWYGNTWFDIAGETNPVLTYHNLPGPSMFRAKLSGNCFGFLYSNTVNVHVDIMPSVTLEDMTICLGSTVAFEALPNYYGGDFYWSDGNSTFPNSYVISISPQSTTTYTVVYQMGNCTSAPVQATVTVIPPLIPTVTVGDTTICAGDLVQLTATGSIAGGLYNWSNGLTGASIWLSPQSTAQISVVYSLGDCLSSPDTATVTVKPVPSVNVQDQVICEVGTSTLIANTDMPGGNYLWSLGNLTTPSITVSPTSTTVYELLYEATNGCTNSATATVHVNPIPTLSLQDSTVCANGIFYFGSDVDLPGGVYTWSNGLSGPGFNFSTPTDTVIKGVYTLNGCSSDTAEALISVGPETLIITTLQDLLACRGDSVLLEVSATGSGSLSYQWIKDGQAIQGETNPGLIIANVDPNSQGFYSVEVAATCGTVSSGLMELKMGAETLIQVQPLNVVQCSQTKAEFLVSATGEGVLQYQWAKNSVNIAGANDSILVLNSINPSDAGNYHVEVSASCGLARSNTVSLAVLDKPDVSLAPFDAVCANTADFVLTGGLPAGGSFFWNNGLQNNVFSPSVAGPGLQVINYVFTNASGCTDTASTTLTVEDCAGLEGAFRHPLMKVYPNPVGETLTVEIYVLGYGKKEILIMNVKGEEVYRQNEILNAGKPDQPEPKGFCQGDLLFKGYFRRKGRNCKIGFEINRDSSCLIY